MGLASDEVELWAVDLARSARECNELAAGLSSDELLRAANMRIEAARRRFIVARACLRLLLGRSLEVSPGDLEIRAARHGKPVVDGASFNIGHSGELCIIALTLERSVGVDVELTRPRSDPAGMARRFFTIAESEAVARSDDPLTCFYSHWVLKEALLKATGLGLAGRLRSFEVALEPVPRIAHVGGDERAAARWSLDLIELPGGYVGALATDGRMRRTPLRRFEPLAAVA